MNLTELQMKLRSIEEQISNLYGEIEKMKPCAEDEQKAMFDSITKMAKEFPLVNEYREKVCNIEAKLYISCLAFLVLGDEGNVYEKLLYLCRIAYGMGLVESAEDIYCSRLGIDRMDFNKMCMDLKDLRYSFLVDVLVLINIAEEASGMLLALIVDLAKIFECDQEDIRTIACVAKSVLINDYNILSQIPPPKNRRWMGQFNMHIPGFWIVKQRQKCGKICIEKQTSPYLHLRTENSTLCIVKQKLQDGIIVKAGEKLLVYEKKSEEKKQDNCIYSSIQKGFLVGGYISKLQNSVKEYTINAPCDGVVFYMEKQCGNSEKYLEIYVISYFDNYLEFCEWQKNN